jgi:hypothetical protein
MSDMQSRIEARREALSLEEARYAKLRQLHGEIGRIFLEDPDSPYAQELLGRALRQIEVWERGETCSRFYIRAWRRVLRDPGRRLGDLAEGEGGMRSAMLQNSPFGFALGAPGSGTGPSSRT